MTPYNKLEALNELDKGNSLQNIAVEFSIRPSTMSDWKKNKKEFKVFALK